MAIVGPNGCGKSNLIDAIRWVLGESSAKQLRGQALDDVIFAGSGQRPAASQAVVELTFDNRERRLNGAFGAYDELVIRRSLGRDGQSQYRINQTRVRRRDVIDLFLGTGVGARSYSVIEQGQVNRIVDAKPEDLRAYLEETAGISVYRERRRETHQRLQQAEENLARLADLSGELERQQSSLERQAKAAERYRTLQKNRRRLLIEQTAVALALAQTTAHEAQAKAEATDQAAQACQYAVVAARHDLQQIEHIRQQAEARRQQLTATHFGLVTARSTRQGKLGELGARLDALAQQQHADQQRLEQLRTETEQLFARQRGLRQEQERLTIARDHAVNARAEHSAALKTADQALIGEREQLHRAMQRTASAQSQRAATQARLDSIHQQIQRLHQRLTAPPPDFATAEQALDAAQNRISADDARLTAERTQLEQALAEAQGAHAQAQADLQAAAHTTRHAQEQHSTQDAERRALEKLLASQRPAHRARSRLIDRLAEADADPFFARALGTLTEADCVPDLDQLAAQWQASGKRPAAGWWISPVSTEIDAPVDAYLADWQQTCHPAHDWAQALTDRHQLAPGHCFVLDDGWRVGRHWFGRPTDDTAAHTLAAHRRLRVLTQSCTESANEFATARTAEAAAQTAMRDAEQRLKQAQVALHHHEQARLRHQFAKQNHDRERREHEATQSRYASENSQRREELATLQSEQDKLSHNLITEDAALAGAETERQQHQAKIQQAEADLNARRRSASEAQQQCQTTERDLDRVNHQLEEILRAVARNEAEQTHIAQRQQEAHTRSARWQQEIETLSGALDEEDRAIAELDQALAAVQQELADHHAAQQAARQRLDAAEQAQEQARSTAQHAALAQSEAHIHQQHAADALAQALRDGQDDGDPPTADAIAALAADPDTPTRQAAERARLEADLQRLGTVNLTAIEAFAETRARKTALDEQMTDVRSAIAQLRDAIAVLDRETRQQFKAVFDAVNARLAPRFQQLFGGGQAHLALTETDAIDAGVQLFAQPPGKKVTQLSLLSGGERALTAVALIFALFEQNPAPFCILDEVDAPLDEANVGRFCDMVSAMSDRVQFLFITHNKTTMASAQALIGVTMREAGVSRIVSVDVERAVAMLTPSPHPH